MPGVLDAGPLTRLEYWGFLAVAGLFRGAAARPGFGCLGPPLARNRALASAAQRAQTNLQVSMPSLSADQQEAYPRGDVGDARAYLCRSVPSRRYQRPMRTACASNCRPTVKAMLFLRHRVRPRLLHMGNWEVACLGGRSVGGCRIAGVYQQSKSARGPGRDRDARPISIRWACSARATIP